MTVVPLLVPSRAFAGIMSKRQARHHAELMASKWCDLALPPCTLAQGVELVRRAGYHCPVCRPGFFALVAIVYGCILPKNNQTCFENSWTYDPCIILWVCPCAWSKLGMQIKHDT
jgi:hypothetical protein